MRGKVSSFFAEQVGREVFKDEIDSVRAFSNRTGLKGKEVSDDTCKDVAATEVPLEEARQRFDLCTS